jgi:hypothetical protein
VTGGSKLRSIRLRWLLANAAELLTDSVRYLALMLILAWLLALATSVGADL